MNTRIKGRWLSWLLAVMMIFNSFPVTTFAIETDVHDHEHDENGVCIVETDASDETSESESSVEPSEEPSPTPAPTVEPTPTPEPTAEPTPAPTAAPTPEPTPAPEVELSAAQQEYQADIDDILNYYLGGVEMSKSEVEEIVSKMDSDTAWIAQVEIYDLEEAMTEDLTEDEILALVDKNPTLVSFAEMLDKYSTGVNMLASVEAIEGKITVADTANTVSVSNGTVTATVKGSLLSKKTNTLTITNAGGATASISFNYTASTYNSFTIDGQSASASGTITKTLDAGASVTVVVKSNSGLTNLTATVTLSNFSWKEAKSESSVTFNYDSSLGSITVGGEAVETGGSKTLSLTTGAALVAAPISGATFLGWVDEEDGKILSQSTSFTLLPTQDMTVKAVFINNNSAPHFYVGGSGKKTESVGLFGLSTLTYYTASASYLFDNLNDATEKATTAGPVVILANSGTLAAGDYTIPSGVTLLIPFDDANTMYKTEAQSVAANGSYVTPSAYRTLTMAEGANLTINGEMSLSAKHCYAQGGHPNAGSPTGNVSFVRMNSGSNITVNNGGALYAYGFITGEGSVTANSGSKIYENFQIMDFRGGTQSTDMDNGVFPLSQYYVQNIEVPTTIYSGATEYSFTTIYMSDTKFASSVGFIGSSGCMFNLTSGHVVKKYDGNTDRLVVDVYGNMTISSINLSIGTNSINSKDYELPVNSNITVNIRDGNQVTINQDIALLPGAQINIDSGATCTLGSNINAYIYDGDNWGTYVFYKNVNAKFAPITYAPGKKYTRTEADLVDASARVDGIMDASKGYVYVTSGGANVYSAASGQVIVGTKGGETVAYQLVQGTGNTQIPIQPGVLKNEDGSLTSTETAGTYTYVNGRWHTMDADGKVCNGFINTSITEATCTEAGLKTTSCACGISNSEVAIPALGHTYIVTTSGKSATCTEAGYTPVETCNNCGDVIASVTIDPLGHDFQYVKDVQAPTCVKEGKASYACSRGDANELRDIPALGHTEAKIPAVAPGCETTGLTAGVKCSVCGEIITAQEVVAATGHTAGEAVQENEFAPSCTVAGNHDEVVYCVTCGDELSRKNVTDASLGHTAVTDAAVAATCTEKGLTVGEHCSVCNAVLVKQSETPALGHTNATPVRENEVAPTCTTEGSYESVVYCTVCDAEVSRTTVTVPVIAHTAGDAVEENRKDATCTEEGSYETVTYCTMCGAETGERVTNTIPATGHTAGEAEIENEVAATCKAAGSYEEVVYCSECNEELSRETKSTPMLDHDIVTDKAVAATCTETGLKAGSHCELCDEVFVAQEVTPALGHIEVVDSAVEASCSAAGKTEGKHCSRCGEVLVAQEEIPALEHKAGDEVTEKEVAATCITAGGYDTVVYCTVCGGEVSRVTTTIAALGHTAGEAEIENEVAADCDTAGGYDTVTYCAVCNEELERVTTEIPALGHTAGEAKIENEVAADCDTAGIYDTVTYCLTCGEEMERVTTTVEALGHKAGEAVKENEVKATCTTGGSYESVVKCTVCGTEMSRDSVTVEALGHTEGPAATCTENQICTVCNEVLVEATGHDYTSEITTAPTCTGTGIETFTCSNCGDDYTGVVDSLGHEEKVVPAVAPTCTATGLTEGKVCERCSLTLEEQETVSALGHDYEGSVTTEPNCTEKGVKTFVCTNDASHTYTEEIAALGHVKGEEVIENVKDATCTTKGSYETVVSCSVCGEELSRVTTETPALGHTDGDPVTENVVPADCVKDGSYESVVYCTVCDAEVSRTTVPVAALGHTPGAEATCTVPQTCTVCGEVVADVIPHNYTEEITTAAGCETTGLKTFTCLACNDSYEEEIAATGHEWFYSGGSEPTCTTAGVGKDALCANCFTRVSGVEQPALGHAWDEGVVTKPSTCAEDGTRLYTCTRADCNATKEEAIIRLPHTEVGMVPVAPTCTTTGLTNGLKCSVCGLVIDEQDVVPALGHTEVVDEAVAPTCENTGLTEGKHCSVCDKVLVAQTVVNALGHDYDDGVITTKPTCTEEGVKIFTCANDESHTYTEIVSALGHTPGAAATCTTAQVCTACGSELVAALGHEWNEGEITTAPTCTGTGVKKLTCGVCNATKTEVVAALGHTETEIPAVAPSCEKTGLTSGVKCSVCGFVITAPTVVAAKGHAYDDGVITTDPTCTAEGVKTFTCANDESHTYTESVSALGHTEAEAVVENNVAPTCTSDGSYDTVVYCSVCDAELSRVTTTVDKLGHTEGEAVTENEVAPECEKDGGYDTVVYCTVCDAELAREHTTIPATGHTESAPVVENQVAQTCTTEGSYDTAVYCTVCDAELSRETTTVPAIGHNEVIDAGKDATCLETGLTEGKHCDRCNETLVPQEEIAALGHDLVKDAAVTPTCTETGLTEGEHCSRCDYVELAQAVLPAKGHNEFVDKAKAPTCTETGLTEGKHCSVCGEVLKAQEVVDALGHEEETIPAVAPTCTETGLKEGVKCSVCGEILKAQEVVDALGHEEETIPAVDPTCTETGLKEGVKCSVCGEILTAQEEIPANGHTPVEDAYVAPTCEETGLTLGRHCSVCGEILAAQEEIPATGHTDALVPGKAPTCTETGLTDGAECSVCGKTTTEQEEIPAKGHDNETVPGKAPTCTETGLTDGEKCKVCKKTTTEQEEIPATGHTEETIPAVEPTCTATGLTEGKHCSVCGEVIVAQDIVNALGHKVVIDLRVEPTCTDTGLTEGSHCERCDKVIIPQEEIDALGHTEVIDEKVDATCLNPGLTEGLHCSVCKEILIEQEEIPQLEHQWGTGRVSTQPTCDEEGVRTFTCSVCRSEKTEAEPALGHDLVKVPAKAPTYTAGGWEEYEYCQRDTNDSEKCIYSTIVLIPALGEPHIESYDEFIENLELLEEIADLYVKKESPGKDPAMLVIKYIRTGVDRYNSGSWNIMAGYEDKGFAKFVTDYESAYNAELEEGQEMMKVSGLKNIENFDLPNGNYADIGHMFGTMDITYTKKTNADVGGWGGDLTDLISLADQYGVESETLEEMVAEIKENYFLWSEEDVEDAHGGIKVLEGTFSETDVFGDLDGFYVMTELEKREYKNGTLTDIISSYMTPSLTNKYRASYFIENRLNGITHRVDLRNAVYSEYTSDEAIATLENTREFNTENLTMLRRACCYVFADYICKVAGDYYELGDNPYLSVFQSETTDLAPGIVQKTYLATTADDQQLAYYTATADVNRADVDLFVNYNNNDPSQGWAMQRVLDQANAAQNRYGNPESEEYIENYQVIAATNGDGYNMETGEPSGLLMMLGTEWHAPKKGEGFFGILKDGTAIIGSYNEYMALKESGEIREALGSFGTTLIEDGKFAVTPSTDYFTDRAGRTAIGITATGKVVMMVADGRQQPFSCGASMQEIAQIMLEAGCVQAINLDGGGSTTYVAKQPGDDELSVVNRPSDGVARSVSSSLFVVSTAPSSTAFDHALIDATNTYLTVGAQTTVNAVALSATGNSVEMPEGVYWAVSDESVGTVTEDGVFTANALGEVDVNLMLGDEIVGTKTLHVVIPDNVYFTKETITGIYGQPVHLPIKAVYEGKDVAIVESDVILTVANKDAGEINGFEFIGYEESGLKKIKVNGALAHDPSITTSITITMYTEGEASFDFENATGGDYQLSWDRQVSNSTIEGTNVYRAVDTELPMETEYTFAIDMSKIDIPEKLESLTYMLPGADMENASAWNFLLQLAERVSVLTTVEAKIFFDEDLKLVSDIAAGDITVVNEYFILKDNGIVYDEEENSLTLTLGWVDQTEAIDPDTASPLCIVSGVKLEPKDDASWNAKDQLVIENSGTISYDIYLRANALYTFANKPENQETYGLLPFINEDWEPVEKGGHFSSTYKDFTDDYTLVNSVKDGWVTETGGFAYYRDGERLTGLQEIDGLFYDFGEIGINVGQTPYTGTYVFENGDEYWFVNGAKNSGWYLLYDRVAYFNPETFKAEVVTIIDELPDGCIIPGYRVYQSESGEIYRIDDDTNTGGHEYVEQENGDFVCSVCGYVRKNMADATVTLSYYVCTYNGNPRTPTVKAYAADGTYLTKYSDTKYPDYNIHRYNNVDVGTSTVTLKAYKRGYYVDRNQWRGNAAGEISVTFEIRPDLPTNVKMTAVDGKPTVTWTAAKAPEVTYVIYQSADGENWTEIGTTTDTSFALDPAQCVDHSIKIGTRKEVDGKVYESLKLTSAVRIPKLTVTATHRTSDGKPKFTWKALANAERYEIYRATSATGTFKKMYTTEGTSYVNTNAKLGKTYFYQVRAYMADGTVRCSSIIENNCLLVDVKITTTHRASDGKPKLTWSAVDKAVKYEVWRSTSANSGFSKMFTTANRSYVNSKAEMGVNYYYKLRVIFEDGTAAYTKTVQNSCLDLTLPMSLIVGNRADGKPTITWTALEGVDHYEVLRSKSATGTFSKMFTTSGVKYTNTNATEGQNYFYKIKVVFKDGTIGYSPVVENSCLVPDIDLKVVVTNRAADGKPKLTWTAAKNAKEYVVYRSTERNGKYTKMFTTTKTSYTNTSAVAGQTYYYKIIVKMNDGSEKFTTIFSATCLE